MNHAYRLVWSELAQAYVPVPESARARGKSKAVEISVAALALLGLAGSAFALSPGALPTGGQVVGGQATISQAGSAMTIQQTTSRAAIDWQSFNIGANASVTFNQPSASAIALNRVVGQDPSQILGSLSANGQIFIVNPAGVLFGRGAQVNAQGILASTRDISVAGFMDGKDVFSGAGTGQVVNEGTLRASPGGYVALIGAQVKNLGEIHAPRGEVRLAAADRVTVTLDHGSLASFTVERGTLDALAGNGGLIKADGGRVYLTADAADRLAKAVVNHTGVIEARGVENRDGTIVLLADMNVGTTNVAGTLDASRLDGSKGGFIETSGHVVNIADGTKVKAGRWLIDPADFTIAATGGNMTGAAATAALAAGDLEIQSSAGSGGGNGDIHVNDAVSWSANTLTLTAARDININAVMTASGSSALVMNTGTANGADAGVAGGTVKVGFNTAGTFKGRVDFPGRSGSGFLTINGEDYTVINSLGAELSATSADLQGMNGYLNGRYALGGNIDASATSGWNGGAGFTPIGDGSFVFTGHFDGLGHSISNLAINRTAYGVGLFGYTGTDSSIRNIGLTGGSVTGDNYVGQLVGRKSGTITNSYATGSATGTYAVGGLVGENNGDITNAYATGNVSGSQFAGGLVGINQGNITVAHAAGSVTGDHAVGGLVGFNGGNITNAYAVSNVTGSDYAGGLAGENYSSISNSHYDIDNALINGTRQVTLGGLYSSQFQDWLNHGLTLDIANYASLAPLGTNRYRIDSVQGLKDLLGFADQSAYTFVLGANLDLAGNAGFSIPYLSADLDGAGYAISNVSVNQQTEMVGFIGNLAWCAAISNIGLVNVSITGRNFVGGLVGQNDGAITGSYVTGNVTGNTAGGDSIGGLVGNNNGTIAGSYATAGVMGDFNTGGLVGRNGGPITGSYATGNVMGGSNVGGLVGEHDGGTIDGSYATGSVTGNHAVGGLVGRNYANITNAYATGNVTGSAYAGGLAGISSGTVSQTYATGKVTGFLFPGGLLGSNSGTVTASFWDTETSGRADNGAGGDGKTTAQMRQLATYAGWDIAGSGGSTAVWRIYEGQSGPLLRSFLAPLVITGGGTRAYDGTTDGLVSYSATPNSNLLGSLFLAGVASKDAGSYTVTPSGLYSNQQGYDIAYASGTLVITPRSGTLPPAPIGAPPPAYIGALATATGGPAATGSTAPPLALVPAPTSESPAASTVLLTNAQGLPMATLHIIDSGLRLTDKLAFQE